MDIIGNFRKVIADMLGSVIETSARGGTSLAVTLQDQTTDMLDLYFLEEKVTGLTLAVDTAISERTLTLSPGHTLTTGNSAGHVIELAHTTNSSFYVGKILSVTGDTVTVSPPINDVYQTGTTSVGTGNPNMVKDAATEVAIDGSETPVVFSVKPLPTQSGDITRVIVVTTSPNASDLSGFGGGGELSVGLTMRYKRQDGTYKNIFTYSSNFDLAIHGYDHSAYDPKAGNTTNGTATRITFAGQHTHGVASRLDGARGEELQIVVSELMDASATGNLSVSFIAQGSELQGN